MRAASVSELPGRGGRELAYEPKWDGWRCVAFVGEQVVLQSRQGKNLTPYFPDIVRQLRDHLPPGVILDGELIIWDQARGRTSFTSLQRRVTAGRAVAREAALHPAHLVVFDLLADAGRRSITDRPLVQRRARLEALLADRSPHLPICPQTRDAGEARRWLRDWADIGIEGIVIKDLASRYTPGTAGWLKLKSRATTEAIIGGVTGSLTDPNVLLLGRLDDRGRLRYVAQTHPLSVTHRRELAQLLAPLTLHGPAVSHPWPQPLPATWGAQLDQRQPLPYVPVPPVIVAEVQVDVAYDAEYGRWRHRARYVRPRTDLSADDVPYWQSESVRGVEQPDPAVFRPADGAAA